METRISRLLVQTRISPIDKNFRDCSWRHEFHELARIGSENNSLPFEAVASKVDEESKAKSGRGEIIQDLLYVGIGQVFDRLRLDEDFVPDNKVGVVIMRQDHALVADFIFLLPTERDSGAAKFDYKCVFIDHFVVALAKFAVNLHAEANK